MGRKSAIKFGTDGWRAVIADGFTFENVERVAQATAVTWLKSPPSGTDPRLAVVGYDRRFLSDQFAQRTAEVLAGNRFKVILASVPCPSQAVSQVVKLNRACGGVMITASHNPPAFNGFKIKAHYGGSADTFISSAIEAAIDLEKPREMEFQKALDSDRIQILDLRMPHLRAIKKLIDFKLVSNSGLRFAHDALYGVGAGIFNLLLDKTQCTVTTLNKDHNPGFGGINPEPIPQNYGPTQAFLKKNPHDLCLVTDGDADRVGAMDGKGNPLTTHQVICVLLRHMVVNRKGRGRVVKALTTTSMVDRMCEAYGLECVETAVGFKYIATEMLKGDVLLGAEESGGIGFQGHLPERDGILAGLMMLEMLAWEGKTLPRLLSQLERRFGPHRYLRHDASYPLEKRAALMKKCAREVPSRLAGSPVVEVKTFDGIKYIAENGAWLMLRGSGTEPVLRIYAETPSEKESQRLLNTGLSMIRRV